MASQQSYGVADETIELLELKTQSTTASEVKDNVNIKTKTKNERHYCAHIARNCTVIHEHGIVLFKPGSRDFAQFISPRKMSKERKSFSIRILKGGKVGSVCIGLVPEDYFANSMPGWEKNSIGYHSDDGGIYAEHSYLTTITKTATDDDVMSVKIDMKNKVWYFKHNGVKIIELNLNMEKQGMYPCIAITSLGGAAQILEEEFWKTDDTDVSIVNPESLLTDKFDHLWISPAENVILTEHYKDIFCGWLLFHNPGKVSVAFRVIFGNKPEQMYSSFLKKNKEWIKHLEVERDDLRDSILVEWKVLTSGHKYSEEKIELLLEEGEEINRKELVVETQPSEDAVRLIRSEDAKITIPVYESEESKKLLQYLLSLSVFKHEYDEAVKNVESLINKEQINLKITNKDGDTLLHLATDFGFTRIATLLLNREGKRNAIPYLKNAAKDIPLDIAIRNKNDTMAELLVTKMNKGSVFKLFWDRKEENEIKYTIKQLLEDGLEKTAVAVMDTFTNRHGAYYFAPLELDYQKRSPNNEQYTSKHLTAYQMLAGKELKKFANHGCVKTLTEVKWNSYAWKVLLVMALIYLLSLFSITFAAITGVAADDVTAYNGPNDAARAVFELLAYMFALWTLLCEVYQIIIHRSYYFKDVFNYMEFASSGLIICVLPLRYAQYQEQWYVFAFGYILWAFRIFKYAALFKITGIFGVILLKLISRDVPKFVVLFLIILLGFSGGLLLSLKGDQDVMVHDETSSFWGILFVGVRSLIEAQPVIDYAGTNGYRPVSCIVTVLFLFVTCVVLLNILIAQLTNRYDKVQTNATCEYEISRARIVAGLELENKLGCLPFLKKRCFNKNLDSSCVWEQNFDVDTALQFYASQLAKTLEISKQDALEKVRSMMDEEQLKYLYQAANQAKRARKESDH